MRAIVKTAPGSGFEMIDVPRPEVGEDDVLIQVKGGGSAGGPLGEGLFLAESAAVEP